MRLIIFSLLLASPSIIGATPEKSFHAGVRREKFNGKITGNKSFLVEIVSTKDSKTWNFLRCELPGNTNCYTYQMEIRKDDKGKWIFEYPSLDGKINVPAKVIGDGLKLDYFTAKFTENNKPCCTITHKQDTSHFVWVQEYVHPEGTTKFVSKFIPISEAQYEKSKAKRPAKSFSPK